MSPIPTDHDKARETVARLRGIQIGSVRANREVLGLQPVTTANAVVQAAADLITAQSEEIQRLRGTLERIEAASKFWSEYPDGNDAIRYAHESTHRLARAALTSGEDG